MISSKHVIKNYVAIVAACINKYSLCVHSRALSHSSFKSWENKLVIFLITLLTGGGDVETNHVSSVHAIQNSSLVDMAVARRHLIRLTQFKCVFLFLLKTKTFHSYNERY